MSLHGQLIEARAAVATRDQLRAERARIAAELATHDRPDGAAVDALIGALARLDVRLQDLATVDADLAQARTAWCADATADRDARQHLDAGWRRNAAEAARVVGESEAAAEARAQVSALIASMTSARRAGRDDLIGIEGAGPAKRALLDRCATDARAIGRALRALAPALDGVATALHEQLVTVAESLRGQDLLLDNPVVDAAVNGNIDQALTSLLAVAAEVDRRDGELVRQRGGLEVERTRLELTEARLLGHPAP